MVKRTSGCNEVVVCIRFLQNLGECGETTTIMIMVLDVLVMLSRDEKPILCLC